MAMAFSSKRSSSSSSLLSLPQDLLRAILLKTPPEALVRSTVLCKRLYSTITSKKFIYDHFNGSPERFLRISDNVKIADPLTGDVSISPVPAAFNDIRYAVHCDGVLLVHMRHENSRRINVAVWNPFLGKARSIALSSYFTASDLFGLGYDTKRSYKILRLSAPNNTGEPKVVEISELSPVSWKIVENAKIEWEVDEACTGLAVRGLMYWIALEKEKVILVTFDFATETFQTKDLSFLDPSHYKFLACFEDDKLSVLKQVVDQNSRKMEVWTSTKLRGDDVSFSKYFTVDHVDLPDLDFIMSHPVYSVGKKKNIYIWCERPEDEDNLSIDNALTTYTTLYEIGEDGVKNQIDTARIEMAVTTPSICGLLYRKSLVPLG